MWCPKSRRTISRVKAKSLSAPTDKRRFGVGAGGPVSDQLSYRLDASGIQSDGWMDRARRVQLARLVGRRQLPATQGAEIHRFARLRRSESAELLGHAADQWPHPGLAFAFKSFNVQWQRYELRRQLDPTQDRVDPDGVVLAEQRRLPPRRATATGATSRRYEYQEARRQRRQARRRTAYEISSRPGAVSATEPGRDVSHQARWRSEERARRRVRREPHQVPSANNDNTTGPTPSLDCCTSIPINPAPGYVRPRAPCIPPEYDAHPTVRAVCRGSI